MRNLLFFNLLKFALLFIAISPFSCGPDTPATSPDAEATPPNTEPAADDANTPPDKVNSNVPKAPESLPEMLKGEWSWPKEPLVVRIVLKRKERVEAPVANPVKTVEIPEKAKEPKVIVEQAEPTKDEESGQGMKDETGSNPAKMEPPLTQQEETVEQAETPTKDEESDQGMKDETGSDPVKMEPPLTQQEEIVEQPVKVEGDKPSQVENVYQPEKVEGDKPSQIVYHTEKVEGDKPSQVENVYRPERVEGDKPSQIVYHTEKAQDPQVIVERGETPATKVPSRTVRKGENEEVWSYPIKVTVPSRVAQQAVIKEWPKKQKTGPSHKPEKIEQESDEKGPENK